MPKILPIKTSNKTKAQIVAEAEATWLYPHLIGTLECGEDCCCIKCYHKVAYVGIKEMLAKVSKDLKGETYDETNVNVGNTIASAVLDIGDIDFKG